MSLAETFRHETQRWGALPTVKTLACPSGGVLPEVGTTLRLPVSEQALSTCFASPYRQIASPYRLAPVVLQSFLAQQAKLRLAPTWGKPLSAGLLSFDEQTLI